MGKVSRIWDTIRSCTSQDKKKICLKTGTSTTKKLNYHPDPMYTAPLPVHVSEYNHLTSWFQPPGDRLSAVNHGQCMTKRWITSSDTSVTINESTWA
ncbi:hypothetical protein FKM82_021337 [Ascaphus truei]